MNETTATVPNTTPIRLKGHRVERIAVRGGTIAECTCNGGTTLVPLTTTARNGANLGLFTGAPEQITAAIRDAHNAHKHAVSGV